MLDRPLTNHVIRLSVIVTLRQRSLCLIRKREIQDLEAPKIRLRNCLHQASLSKPVPVLHTPNSNPTVATTAWRVTSVVPVDSES